MLRNNSNQSFLLWTLNHAGPHERERERETGREKITNHFASISAGDNGMNGKGKERGRGDLTRVLATKNNSIVVLE